MLTQEIRNKVQRLWNMFWSRGITNPITAIEQISYLLFIRRLEEVDEYDNVTNVKKKSIFKGHEMCLWSRFSTLPPSDMLECYQNEVFPFIKTLNGEDEPFAQYMSDAVNEISQPNLLFDSVNIINSIYSDIERDKEQGQHFQDVQGDIYEYLINEIATSGKNGQFRTPRHIIQFICDLISPDVNDTICDPACGTGGFLLGALQSVLTKHTPANKRKKDENGLWRYQNSSDAILNESEKEKVSNSLLFGFDIDKTMVRIGLMNLMLHGIAHPRIERMNTLSSLFYAQKENQKYSVIMANPPFTGTVSMEELSEDLLEYGKKSELLFLIRIISMLKIGGRAAVIVPDGVLFSTGKKAKSVREKLLKDCSLNAVISLPSGVFKPYAGVKTSILLFTKVEDGSSDWHTNDIWYYELSSDGYSLDDNRRKLTENPLSAALDKFQNRDKLLKKTKQYFHLSIDEVNKRTLELHFDKYKIYEEEREDFRPPHELMKDIMSLEKNIMKNLQKLNGMI